MAYYSPQRGDYYGRGDPGFLSDVWKGVKDVGKKVAGYALGGGLGGMAGRAGAQALQAPLPNFPGVGPIQPGPGKGMVVANGGNCCPSGYHPAKDGSGRCVKNRSMNITNPKALRRAIRRVQGFEKISKRVINFNKRVRTK